MDRGQVCRGDGLVEAFAVRRSTLPGLESFGPHLRVEPGDAL